MEGTSTLIMNNNTEMPVTEMNTITFKYGLPGFEALNNFRVDEVGAFPPFQMLYSLDEEKFSLLILKLSVLNIENELELLLSELKAKGIKIEENDIFLVLKLDRKNKIFTANIKAPLIISKDNNQGTQLILENPDLPVDFILSKV
ncbi:MAG: flagellar assembly protein FliW [Candidatus Marinimicrobia bacterium]|nr:flagellar assembly protein FliW [Candidatus Neomarinimicrobiota bacterium]